MNDIHCPRHYVLPHSFITPLAPKNVIESEPAFAGVLWRSRFPSHYGLGFLERSSTALWAWRREPGGGRAGWALSEWECVGGLGCATWDTGRRCRRWDPVRMWAVLLLLELELMELELMLMVFSPRNDNLFRDTVHATWAVTGLRFCCIRLRCRFWIPVEGQLKEWVYAGNTDKTRLGRTPAYWLGGMIPEMAIWGLSVLTVSVLARPHTIPERVTQSPLVLQNAFSLVHK
jgi:hypothetical protein